MVNLDSKFRLIEIEIEIKEFLIFDRNRQLKW